MMLGGFKPTPLKNDGVKVNGFRMPSHIVIYSWDDEKPINEMEHKIHVWNHQQAMNNLNQIFAGQPFGLDPKLWNHEISFLKKTTDVWTNLPFNTLLFATPNDNLWI